MDRPYFIMMYNQTGQYIMPIVDELEDVEQFSTYEEAKQLAENHYWCSNFGYEIFCMGNGVRNDA